MPDYDQLQKQLAQAIVKADGKLSEDLQAFVAQFTAELRAKGWQIDEGSQQALTQWLDGIHATIAANIETALTVAAAAGILSSPEIAALSEEAFSRKWPDGLTLSDRLWNWNKDVKTGLTQTLKHAVQSGQSLNKTLYDMQRLIERANGGQRFKIVERYQDDWVKELHAAAADMIHNPASQVLWEKAIAEAQDHIDTLKVTGTKPAAERVLSQIKKAVEKGKEELADQAARWWLYDKQLYHLKRIIRTEMADAGHQAIIASTEQDGDVIGYHWRLSGSHPATDICDYYANIELGLGRGVWPKDQVPRHKAHPHCMCNITPRVAPVKARGMKNYARFIEKLPEAKLDELLPNWVKDAKADGIPLTQLIRKDGLGLITKQAAQPLIKNAKINTILDKLTNRLADAQQVSDVWVDMSKYDRHLIKRIKSQHIVDESDYWNKIDAALREVSVVRLASGKLPGVSLLELASNNWSVIVNQDGKIKTAYQHEPAMEGFTDIESRLGQTLYERRISTAIKRRLVGLRNLRGILVG